MTYGRMLEVQARMLSGHVRGDIPRYVIVEREVFMELEHYYVFVDRTVVDPFLALSWPEFHKIYGWSDRTQWSSAAEFLIEFALEPEPDDPVVVEDILSRRTLRWTLRRSCPQFFCLAEGLLVHAPHIAKRCPGIATPTQDEVPLFLATAAYGFLERRITQRTLWAVFALHGCGNEPQWLSLPWKQERQLRAALAPSPLSVPVFPWQNENS